MLLKRAKPRHPQTVAYEQPVEYEVELYDHQALGEVEEPDPLSSEELRRQAFQRARLFDTGSAYKRTRRQEIVGIDNVLGEIDEIIHWLRHAEAYGQHGARLQPGVIFSGEPGTGKTLVSRWIATASEALFVNVRDFVHNGALFNDRDIADLFRLARETYARDHQPIILFWDEFENAAIERSDGKTTPEQGAVVSQLTAELDGIHGKNEGLLLIGCTNYFENVDAALRRRGRMGVHIEFHAPDRAGKEKILAYYLQDRPTADNVDVQTLSYFFPKHNTAADIEEACVEAWRHAVARAIRAEETTPHLNQKDLVKVFIKQLVGPPTTFTLPTDERMPIAIHECGHAICALTYGIPLRLVTVQPGKTALGRIMVDDVKEYVGTVPEALNYMKMLLGGVAGERTAGLDPMTGAVADIARVNETAEYLVDQLHAGERTGIFGPTSLGRKVGYEMMMPQVSATYLADADDDVADLLHEIEEAAHTATDRVGKANLIRIAETVNERVTMTGTEFRNLYIEICGFEPESEA